MSPLVIELADLRQRADALAAHPAALTAFDDEERARAARFAHQGQARLFLAGRQWLHARLLVATGRERVSFSVGPHGKPYIDGGPHFSFSRSGPYAGLAVSPDAPLGFDLERGRPTDMHEPLVRAVADVLTKDALLPRDLALMRSWTMVEALAKRDGGPVHALLDDPAGAERVLDAVQAGLVLPVGAGPGLVAALAVMQRTRLPKPVWTD